MLLLMTEHTFSHGLLRGDADDLLCAAILHHLLERAPDGCTRRDMAMRLIGRPPGAGEDRTLAGRVAALRAEGLVAGAGGWIVATRPARAFHRIMLGPGAAPDGRR